MQLFIFLISMIFCGFTFDSNSKNAKSGEIIVCWADTLSGDFSFTKNWDYPEGVYNNHFGQLSCDGLCPPEIDGMKDENGRIFEDSITAFYNLVDTTHQFHSIQSDAWAYEWAGTNFVTVSRKKADTTFCFTHKNVGTHSSLVLIITDNKCIPTIHLYSVIVSRSGMNGEKIYRCKSGHIEIDKILWETGIVKAKFDFVFDHTDNPNKPMYWKGKIYANIGNK
jgi:hypothetical protein